MLALSRKKGESIMIGESIEVKVIDIKENNVRISIGAPSAMSIHRKEVFESIKKNGPINQDIRG